MTSKTASGGLDRHQPHELAPGPEVHLWLGTLDDDAGLEEWPAVLSDDECARAARFRREQDRRWFAKGRMYLRSVLGIYLGIPGEALGFRYTDAGKPELDGYSGLGFSVSHCEHLLLIGVGTTPIGVDVEFVRPVPDLAAVAAQAFTGREREHLDRDAAERTPTAFFRWWTAKEALVKGLGRGFSSDPRDVELGPALDGFQWGTWSVQCLEVTAVAGRSAQAAVATPGPPRAIRLLRLGTPPEGVAA
jgi:4'-phosphopantetheinyl transferase